MAACQPWTSKIQDGDRKYGSFFWEDDHELLWLANFMNINRLIRRREDDLVYLDTWRQGWHELDQRLFSITPFALLPFVDFPFLRSEWVAERSLMYTMPSLRNLLTQNNFSDVDVLWIGHPRLYSITKLVNYKILVYRMSDDVAEYEYEPKTVNQIEAKICSKADIVFATAQRLIDKARQNADNVYYLPNGAQFEFFNEPNLIIPPDLKKIPKPTILFLGIINDRLDFNLLQNLTDRLLDYSFVFVGPAFGTPRVKNGVAKLAEKENCHFLGSRSFFQIRRYMQHSDVGLIPFVSNDLTNAMSPIKLFQYAASGLPIVAARLNEIDYLNSPAMLYDNLDECVDLIINAVENKELLSPVSIDFARANTWRKRYGEIKECIDGLL